MTDRQAAINCARAYLTEARRRRSGAFFWVLMEWAANARKRAAAGQRELFA